MAQGRNKRKNRRSKAQAAEHTTVAPGGQARRRAQRKEQSAKRPGDPKAPAIAERPATTTGLALLLAGGLLIAAVAVLGGLWLGQWNSFSYPDSFWLYLLIGFTAAAPALGYVAAERRDVDKWVLLGGVAALTALIVEVVTGPSCPAGADCGVIGARGAYGLAGSVVAVVGLTLLARWMGVWMFEYASVRRYRGGRASSSRAFKTLVGVGLLASVPLTVTLVAVDAIARPEPGMAKRAEKQVAEYCFRITQQAPELAVRADPVTKRSSWKSFLVRRTGESRGGIKGHPVPKGEAVLNAKESSPYEAAVSFGGPDDKTVDLSCGFISGKSVVDKFDYPTIDLNSENPLKDTTGNFDVLQSLQNAGQQATSEAATKAAKPKKREKK